MRSIPKVGVDAITVVCILFMYLLGVITAGVKVISRGNKLGPLYVGFLCGALFSTGSASVDIHGDTPFELFPKLFGAPRCAAPALSSKRVMLVL